MAADWIGATIVRVAIATGRPVADVAGEPFALTLWTQLHVAEIERQSRLEHRFGRLDSAYLGAIAFHQPDKLEDARHRLERELYVFDEEKAVDLAKEIIAAVKAHDEARARQLAAGAAASDHMTS